MFRILKMLQNNFTLYIDLIWFFLLSRYVQVSLKFAVSGPFNIDRTTLAQSKRVSITPQNQSCWSCGISHVFFKNRGEILVFWKNVEFLEFFGFTLCFRTFQAKKIFEFFFQPTDRKILQINKVNWWRNFAISLKFFCLKCREN